MIQQCGWDTFLSAGRNLVIVKADVENDTIYNYIGNEINLPAHPRILMDANDIESIKKSITIDENWSKIEQIILTSADLMLTKKLSVSVINGNTTIDNPTDCFRRLFFLSYCYRLTKQKKYLDAAVSDLESTALVNDWIPRQPSRLTYTAEIMMGVAIAYDWLYNDLSTSNRMLIQKAIVKKGLEPTLDPFYDSMLNNAEQSQICNSSRISAALAIYDFQSKVAKQILNKSIAALTKSMNSVYNHGAYPSGYQFSTLGTNFNALAIDILKKTLNKDFGLTKIGGFFKSADYLQNLTGPSGATFDFSDGVENFDIKPNPCAYWFANQSKNMALIWTTHDILIHGTYKDFSGNRLLPALMIWGSKIQGKNPEQPVEKVWINTGNNALALMRTSWKDRNAIFVGLKAGSPSVVHSHMDIGSFIFDANGLRWAEDLGGEELQKFVWKGINIFDMSANSMRWKMFRENTKSHNTLTVNNTDQQVNATADIIEFSKNKDFMYAITDMTAVYNGALKAARRGVAIVDENHILVRDEFQTINSDNVIRWKIVTSAAVKLIGNKAELTIDDKKYYMKVVEPSTVRLQTWSASPSYSYESRNNGKTILGFEIKNNKSENLNISVIFSADSARLETLKPLKVWSANK